ncbi:MAG: hypothetical protein AABX29_09005 [Nanoarchaeota archaeon]
MADKPKEHYDENTATQMYRGIEEAVRSHDSNKVNAATTTAFGLGQGVEPVNIGYLNDFLAPYTEDMKKAFETHKLDAIQGSTAIGKAGQKLVSVIVGSYVGRYGNLEDENNRKALAEQNLQALVEKLASEKQQKK